MVSGHCETLTVRSELWLAMTAASAQGSTSGTLLGAENTIYIERAKAVMADYILAFSHTKTFLY
jgi:hypothetical protein